MIVAVGFFCFWHLASLELVWCLRSNIRETVTRGQDNRARARPGLLKKVLAPVV